MTPLQESDVLAVVEGGDGSFSWLNTQPPYSCSIASPKKESKLKGLKSFIAYQLTPSVSCLLGVRSVYSCFESDSFLIHNSVLSPFLAFYPRIDSEVFGKRTNL